MTGGDLGVPVRYKYMIPVNVLVVHTGRAVPQVVENVDIIEYAVVSVRFCEDHLGVAAAHVELVRRHHHVFRVQPLPLGPLTDEVHAGGQVREAVAGFQRPESHHGPENEEREEKERHKSFSAEPSHRRCPWCCKRTSPEASSGVTRLNDGRSP